MAKKNRSKSSLIAGSFLIFGLIGFVIISSIVSGAIGRLHPTNSYNIRFALSQSTAGLKPGATVLMGGQPVGRVSRVSFLSEGEETVGVNVIVKINSGQVLFGDSVFVLERPLIGVGASINIINGGTAAAGTLEPGSTVTAGLAVPTFLAAAGFGAEQIKQVQAIISDTKDIVARTDQITAELEDDLEQVLTNLNEFTENLTAIETDIIADSTGDAVNEFRALVEESRDLLRANRPRVDDVMSSAQRTMARFENEHTSALLETIEKTSEAADNLAEVAEQSSQILATETPAIKRTLANARLASDQLRLAMIEIRRNPWKLLGQPDKKELKEELFYDAARAYALVASDLQDAGASLESALAKPGATDEELIRQLSEDVKSALVRYKEAEVRLLEQMFE
jgi:ABC-type transporter Mla subunit MlaD